MEDNNLEERKEQITALVTAYYNKFDFLQNGQLNGLIDKALDRYLDSDLTIEEINEELMKLIVKRKKEIDLRYDKDKVRDNHKELYGTLESLVTLLEKAGIDYQLAGALCSYLKYGKESNRVHDDIDLNMNEDDLEKFAAVCERLGFVLHDRRLDSPRVLKNGIPSGEHEVVAEIPGSDLHIGVFCFKRNKDGSIDNRSYYKDEDGKPMVWNEHISPELAKIIFGSEKIEYEGRKIIITPPEYVYSLKSYTKNNKDLNDLRFMDGKIDMDKVNEIQTLNKTDRRVDLVSIDNSFNDEIDNQDELSTMIEPEIEKEEVKSNELEKPKVYVKKDNNLNENGIVHYRQLIVPFIVLVVIVIVIEIFNFVSLNG